MSDSLDRRETLALLGLAGFALAAPAAAQAQMTAIPTPDVTIRDSSLTLADGRVVPLRLYTGAPGQPRPLIMFSHGANSRPDKYDRLCIPLAAAGYSVAAPLHADSPDHPGGGKIPREDGIPMRLADMRALLARRGELGPEFGPGPAIAAGHSYGGWIAQIMAGAFAPPLAPAPSDAGIAAILTYSPPGPFPPGITAESWKTVSLPMLVQTGTADVLPLMAPEWQVHRMSHDTTPAPSVLFVGDGVDHYFGNIICRPERTQPPKTAEFEMAVALSIAFLQRVRTGQGLASLAYPGPSWVEVRNSG
jgi:predicted alpha/beta-hydrolase family hydrolase